MKILSVESVVGPHVAPASLITRQNISHLQLCSLYHSHVPDASFSVVWFRPESFSKVSSSLSPPSPENREADREGKCAGESSKVTFRVSPLELVSSWQGLDSFNFSATVRSSLFFKRLWDRYKQRKMLPDFLVLSEGHSFSPALSLCQKWAFSDSCQIQPPRTDC